MADPEPLPLRRRSRQRALAVLRLRRLASPARPYPLRGLPPRHARSVLSRAAFRSNTSRSGSIGSLPSTGSARSGSRLLFTSDARPTRTESFWLHSWNAQVIPYGASQAPRATPSRIQRGLLRALCFSSRSRRHRRQNRICSSSAASIPKKGCDLLVDAFAKIAPQAPDLELVFAGPDQTGSGAPSSKSRQSRKQASQTVSTGPACFKAT